jgi:hypothetical protein
LQNRQRPQIDDLPASESGIREGGGERQHSENRQTSHRVAPPCATRPAIGDLSFNIGWIGYAECDRCEGAPLRNLPLLQSCRSWKHGGV